MNELSKLSFIITINLKEIAQSLSSGMDPLIPYMTIVDKEKDSENIKFLGYAQFENDKLVGVYEGDAAVGIHWFYPKFIPFTFTFEIQNQAGEVEPITIKVFEGSQWMRPYIKDGEVEIDFNVRARGAVQESRMSSDLRFIDDRDELNKQFSMQIREHIDAFISQAKKKRTDSAQWGLL